MAVAHDSATESHTGTAGSVSVASFDWTIAPTGTLKGLLVFTFTAGSSTEKALSVKIDPTGANIDVPAVTGGRAVDTSTEPGSCKAWFLGSGIPTGTLTLRVNRTNDTNVVYAVAIGVTADIDTAVHEAGIVLLQENGALSVQSVTDGSPGSNSMRYAGTWYGGTSVPPAGSGSTNLHSIVYSNDPNSGSSVVCRESTAGQGARNVGFSAATDDRAAVHLAIKEAGTPATATPDTVAAVAATPSPSPSAAGTVVDPTTVGAITAVHTPTIQVEGGADATPDTVAAQASVPAPTITTSATATPSTVTAVAAVPTPNVLTVGSPIPTVRGTAEAAGQLTTTINLTVSSTCTAFKYLACYISKGGTGSLGAPPVVTSDNGSFTGYEIVPYSAHGSAFPTDANGWDNSVASGPRAGWLITLEGAVESGDVLTLTMEQQCEEWAVYLLDEDGGGGITHVVPTPSLANSTSYNLHHQALTHESSGVRGLCWTGGGDDEPIPDGDEDGELASWAYNPGIAGGSLVYKDGAFPGYILQWTWSSSWSNQGMAWEVYPTGGDGGSPVRIEQITNQTDAGAAATIPSAGSFTPSNGDVIVLVSTYEQGTLGDHSVTDTQGSPATYTTVTDGSTEAKVDPDSTHRTVMKAKRYTSSPGAIQVNFNGAGSVLGSVHSLFRLIGTDGSTDTDWAEQVDTATDDSATSIAASLSALASTSGALAVVSADASTEDIDFEDGFVPTDERDPLGVGVETQAQHVVWLADNSDASPSFSVGGSARDLAVIAIEVLAAPQAQDATATPSTVTAVAAVPASSTLAQATSSPSTIAAQAATPAPTITAAATPTPSTVTAQAAVPAPSPQAAATVTPSTVTSTTAVPAPTAQAGAVTTPTTVAAQATVWDPSVQIAGGATATPATVQAVAAVPTPTIERTATATPVTVQAQAAVPAPTIQAGTGTDATPSTVQAQAAVPAPTITRSATATPSMVQAQATVHAPAIQTGSDITVTPDTVTAQVTIPASSAQAAATATPSLIPALAALDLPTITLSAEATPSTVQSVASVPTPTVFIQDAGTAYPDVVLVTASVPTPTITIHPNFPEWPVAVTGEWQMAPASEWLVGASPEWEE
jgi:hypothetical protein